MVFKKDLNWKKKKVVEVTAKPKPKNKADFIAEIVEKTGHALNKKLKKEALEAIAVKNDIEWNKNVKFGIVELWVDKPKGMFDIAYERGLLDLKTYYYHQFLVQGALSDTGSWIDKTSLASLLGKCDDFLNEETMLQQTMKKLGATLVQTNSKISLQDCRRRSGILLG